MVQSATIIGTVQVVAVPYMLQPNWPNRQSGLPGRQTALALPAYFCETANVVEPLRPVLRSNVVTGAGIVPWKEYWPKVATA